MGDSQVVCWTTREHIDHGSYLVMQPACCAVALCTVVAIVQIGGSPVLALPGARASSEHFGSSENQVADAPPKSGDGRWLQYLETVSGWIMQRHLSTDNLTHCESFAHSCTLTVHCE